MIFLRAILGKAIPDSGSESKETKRFFASEAHQVARKPPSIGRANPLSIAAASLSRKQTTDPISHTQQSVPMEFAEASGPPFQDRSTHVFPFRSLQVTSARRFLKSI